MQSTPFKFRLLAVLLLVTAGFATLGFTGKFGLDSYEIYLNKSLIMKQYVNHPVALRKLPLDKAKPGDELRIIYRHCHEPQVGSNRIITIKDDRNKTLKQWNFGNGTGKELVMIIQVKALLELQEQSGHCQLSLHYSSRELPQAEMLAKLDFN